MRLIIPAVALFAFPACIEFDEQLVFDEPTAEPATPDTPERPGPVRPDTPDTPDTPEPTSSVALTPDTAELCDILLVSLTNDDDLEIFEVGFFGPSDVSVLTYDDRPGELLLTLQVSADGNIGLNDLLLELDDGSTVVVEDAFEVTGDGC